MQTKLLEDHDRGTFIPVMATAFDGTEHQLLRTAGFTGQERYVIVVKLVEGGAQYDPHAWNGRTMLEAHRYIEKEWDSLLDGGVVDVEFILGETKVCKTSQ